MLSLGRNQHGAGKRGIRFHRKLDFRSRFRSPLSGFIAGQEPGAGVAQETAGDFEQADTEGPTSHPGPADSAILSTALGHALPSGPGGVTVRPDPSHPSLRSFASRKERLNPA